MGLNFLLCSYYHNLIPQPTLSSCPLNSLTSILPVHHMDSSSQNTIFNQVIPFEKFIKAPQCLQRKHLPGLKGLLKPTAGYQQSLLCAFYFNKAVPLFARPQVFRCRSITEHLLFCPQPNPILQGLTSSLVSHQAHPYRFTAAYKQKVLQEGSSRGSWVLPLVLTSSSMWLGADFCGTTYPRLLFPRQYNEKLNESISKISLGLKIL